MLSKELLFTKHCRQCVKKQRHHFADKGPYSQGVGKIPWRRKWQRTPVLLPGESHGQRSLVGYSPWGRKEPDTTERLHFMGFPAVMQRYESCTIKKVEYQRIDAFELWCWRRLLTVPCKSRSNQSVLKEIRWMLKLKLQYFGQLI